MDLSHIYLAVCREKFRLHLAVDIDSFCWADRIRQDRTEIDRIREEATWSLSFLNYINQNNQLTPVLVIWFSVKLDRTGRNLKPCWFLVLHRSENSTKQKILCHSPLITFSYWSHYFMLMHSVAKVYAVLPFYDVKCLCSGGREWGREGSHSL